VLSRFTQLAKTEIPEAKSLEVDLWKYAKQTGQFRYGEALQKSYLFYEMQRSGKLPGSNRIEWRNNTGVKDGADIGGNLSGGYYDAGDHMKFGLPMAYNNTMLAWGVIEFKDGYKNSGQLDEAKAAIKWGTDYFLKSIIWDKQGVREFYGQVGNSTILKDYWQPHEKLKIQHPSYKIDRSHPGTDLACETAAALASASIVFKQSNPKYSKKLLNYARGLYDFGEKHLGKYSDSINAYARKDSYQSSGYGDELAWAATWMYKATKNTKYLNKAEKYYQEHIKGLSDGWTIDWDNKTHGVAVLLAQSTKKTQYINQTERWLDSWAQGKNGLQITQGGQAWISPWGSTQYAANTAFLAAIYSDSIRDPNGSYSTFAKNQVDYLLGDNPRNFSYMVGFGHQYALQPHHQTAHGKEGWNAFNSNTPNEHILYGALVGGIKSPNDWDYVDDRKDYIGNEVSISYNSGFTGALAYMYDKFGGNPLTDQQLDLLPGVDIN
jgi:hypothetical protein